MPPTPWIWSGSTDSLLRAGYSKSDRMSLRRLVYKETGFHLGPGLSPFPRDQLWGKPGACRELYPGEAHVARNECLLLTAMEDLWLLTAAWVSSRADSPLPPPHTSLEMTEDPADILSATLCEILSQRYLASHTWMAGPRKLSQVINVVLGCSVWGKHSRKRKQICEATLLASDPPPLLGLKFQGNQEMVETTDRLGLKKNVRKRTSVPFTMCLSERTSPYLTLTRQYVANVGDDWQCGMSQLRAWNGRLSGLFPGFGYYKGALNIYV